ncbi:hypothetical protein BGZ73_005202 [Actinomortierella ambigua]|nr:hypothetical protein BGZ73_005202 [Actinomortierella ambigua]
MPPTNLKVLIAGAGIGGVCLAIFLEKAGIQYEILEQSPSPKCLGGGISLSSQVQRVFEQIGLLEELRSVSKPLMHVEYFDQQLRKVGQLDLSDFDKRYGYHSIFFARPDLMDALLKHIPANKIHWGKKIVETVQDENGTAVTCEDGSTFKGDILIGADGAYSAVRRSMYKNMTAGGSPPPKEDTGALRLDTFSIVGVSKPMGDKYPILNEPTTKMQVILASKEVSYNVYAIPMTDERLAWTVGGNFLTAKALNQEDFRHAEWGSEAFGNIRQGIETIGITIGETIGNVIGHTDPKNISRVLVEDKLFSVWYDGRTCLMGDAAHKLVPAGGQGAIQTILDAVCLTNLFYEMSSTSQEDVSKVFGRYYEIRYPTAQKCIDGSARLSKLMIGQGWLANMMRSIVLNLPPWLAHKAQDSMFSGQPQLNFLPSIPHRGECKDTTVHYTLQGAVTV